MNKLTSKRLQELSHSVTCFDGGNHLYWQNLAGALNTFFHEDVKPVMSFKDCETRFQVLEANVGKLRKAFSFAVPHLPEHWDMDDKPVEMKAAFPNLERDLSTRVTKWNGKDHKLVPGTLQVAPCGDPGCACAEESLETLEARRDELIWATGAWIRPEDNAVIQKRIQELDALIEKAR